MLPIQSTIGTTHLSIEKCCLPACNRQCNGDWLFNSGALGAIGTEPAETVGTSAAPLGLDPFLPGARLFTRLLRVNGALYRIRGC